MTSFQVEKLSSPLALNPAPEHNAYEPIIYQNQHVLAWTLSALGSATRAISGRIEAGQIRDLRVLFNLSDGSREVVSFPDVDISVGENRKIYYADYVTETILSIELPGFEDFSPDEMEFPVVHAVRYHDTAVTTADALEWIGPKTDIYAHVPIGEIIAIHPYAPTPDSYFFKFCDGTGQLGDNFPGHETDAVPNLTDNRFLMGGTGYGTGGSNVLLDHTHSCGDQNQNHYHNISPSSINSGYQSQGHTHNAPVGGSIYHGTSESYTTPQVDRRHVQINTGPTSDVSQSHYHSVNFGSFNSGNNSQVHQHAIGSGATPGATSSLPRYFKVLFFMRTN
ncbi:hypothetical protein KJ966_24540 [bacterium]|nr:hypothetical protein [bacterium]